MLLVSVGSFAKVANVGSWQVIPLPKVIDATGKKPFVINSKTTVFYEKNDAEQKRNAQFLVSYIREMTGIVVSITDRMSSNQIWLSVNSSLSGSEAYRLTVDSKAMSLEGSTHAGVFYGMQTIMKALPVVSGVKEVALPSAVVSDSPRFGYRAFMIDCGRHFFSVDYLKKLIDVFAMHNINYFHWHLTEDQGWRIEIKKYPKLTEIGSKRSETTLGHIKW